MRLAKVRLIMGLFVWLPMLLSGRAWAEKPSEVDIDSVAVVVLPTEMQEGTAAAPKATPVFITPRPPAGTGAPAATHTSAPQKTALPPKHTAAQWVNGFVLPGAMAGDAVTLAVPVSFTIDGATLSTNAAMDGDATAYDQRLTSAIEWAQVQLDTPAGGEGPFERVGDASPSVLIDEDGNHGYARIEGAVIRPDAQGREYLLSFTVRWLPIGATEPETARVRSYLRVVGSALTETRQPVLPPPGGDAGDTQTEQTLAATRTEIIRHTITLEPSMLSQLHAGDVVALPLSVRMENSMGTWHSAVDAQGNVVPFEQGQAPSDFAQTLPDGLCEVTVTIDETLFQQEGFPFALGDAPTTVTVVSDGENFGYAVFAGLVVQGSEHTSYWPVSFTVHWTMRAQDSPPVP